MTNHPETDILWFTDNGRDDWYVEVYCAVRSTMKWHCIVAASHTPVLPGKWRALLSYPNELAALPSHSQADVYRIATDTGCNDCRAQACTSGAYSKAGGPLSYLPFMKATAAEPICDSSPFISNMINGGFLCPIFCQSFPQEARETLCKRLLSFSIEPANWPPANCETKQSSPELKLSQFVIH